MDLEQALKSFANSDLRKARAEGEIAIAQTKLGALALSHVDGVYTLVKCGMHPETLAVGKPAVVRPVLMNAYDVVEG